LPTFFRYNSIDAPADILLNEYVVAPDSVCVNCVLALQSIAGVVPLSAVGAEAPPPPQ